MRGREKYIGVSQPGLMRSSNISRQNMYALSYGGFVQQRGRIVSIMEEFSDSLVHC
jgi:hypothetical protein